MSRFRILPQIFVRLGVVLLIAFNLLWSRDRSSLRDFGSFYASGRAAANGLNPYDWTNPLVSSVNFTRLEIEAYTPNLNPPISLFAAEALARFEIGAAFEAWWWVSLALYLLGVILLVRFTQSQNRPLLVFWALSLAGFWHTLELGQIYTPLFLAVTAAWILLNRGHKAGAGLLIGFVAAVKPNFAIWILLLLAGGEMVTVFYSILCAAAMTMLPVLFYGPDVYFQWLQASREFQGLEFPGNSSLMAFTARLGAPLPGVILSVLLVAALVWLVWKRKPHFNLTNSLGIVGSLLASPIAWSGYTIFVLPIFFRRKWSLSLKIAALILVVPFFIVLVLFQLSTLNFILFGWTYGWALLLILSDLLLELKQPGTPRRRE